MSDSVFSFLSFFSPFLAFPFPPNSFIPPLTDAGVVNAALDGVTDLCAKYQDTLQAEVTSLTDTQTVLQARMLDTDRLASHVLRSTRTRADRLDGETTGLKGGAAVDALADASEATHTLLTSIVSTLLAIDEMLPPQDRLSPPSSAHRKHYPRLHALLVGKAAELNVCFASARSQNAKRPSTAAAFPAPSSSTGSTGGGPSSDRDLPLRRRLSSSSQILLSAAVGSRAGPPPAPPGAPPPHLQLRTILPCSDLCSPGAVDDSAEEGSYFPIAPQTATGISLAHSSGKTSSSSPFKRSSAIWGTRPSTSTPPIDEGESPTAAASPGSCAPPPQPPPPPGRSIASGWRRSSGSWSGFGGLFGGRSSRDSGGGGSGKQQGRDRAQERLKRLLETSNNNTQQQQQAWKGKGKARRVATSSW